MTRAARTLAALAAAVALLAPAPLAAQRGSSTASYTVRLADNAYALIAPEGNSLALTGPDGVLLAVDRFIMPTPELRLTLDSIGGGKVRFVLLSGWSDQGTPSAAPWAKTGAMVIAHETVRDRMRAALAVEANAQVPGFTGPTAAVPETGTLPAISFSEVIALEFDGDDTHAVHQTAAHSPGDASIHLHRSNCMYLGALYANGGYPEIDTAAGGSVDGIIAAIGRVLPNIGAQTRIVPGRGPVANKAMLTGYRDMLVAVRDRIERQVVRGRSVQQVLASKPTAELDATWGKGGVAADEFVAGVYRSMSRRK